MEKVVSIHIQLTKKEHKQLKQIKKENGKTWKQVLKIGVRHLETTK